MGNYELSQSADEDFENIFDYGIDTFGLDQALKYQHSMKQRFEELAEQHCQLKSKWADSRPLASNPNAE